MSGDRIHGGIFDLLGYSFKGCCEVWYTTRRLLQSSTWTIFSLN